MTPKDGTETKGTGAANDTGAKAAAAITGAGVVAWSMPASDPKRSKIRSHEANACPKWKQVVRSRTPAADSFLASTGCASLEVAGSKREIPAAAASAMSAAHCVERKEQADGNMAAIGIET